MNKEQTELTGLHIERAKLYREVYLLWEEKHIEEKYLNDNIAADKAKKAAGHFNQAIIAKEDNK